MTTEEIVGEMNPRTQGIDYALFQVTDYQIVPNDKDDRGEDWVTLTPKKGGLEQHTLRRSSLSEVVRSMEQQPGWRESDQYRAARRLQHEAQELYLQQIMQT